MEVRVMAEWSCANHYRRVRNKMIDPLITSVMQAGVKTVDEIVDGIGPSQTDAKEIRCRLYSMEQRGLVVKCERIIGKYEKRWRLA
jgi:hypothetical protein